MKNAIFGNRNPFDVSGKIVLITGAGSGLGKGYSHVFAELGSTVCCADVNEKAVKATVDGIVEDGGLAHAYTVDVSKTDTIKAMVGQIIKDHGRIDVLVNNAGTDDCKHVLDVTPENFDYINNVNMRGSFFVAQEVAKTMVARGQGGKIVNISSINAFLGMEGSCIYAAGKAGVLLYSKSMAMELAPHNIQVNAICPGFCQTPMADLFIHCEDDLKAIMRNIPMQRAGGPKDIAGPILLLSSEASDYMTGTYIIVDGGWMAG